MVDEATSGVACAGEATSRVVCADDARTTRGDLWGSLREATSGVVCTRRPLG